MPTFTLLEPGFLAWGAALIAIPVLIHLLMRKRPVEAPFPTLRFLRQASKRHARNIKLRHWLLLLLRCLLIALALLSFARPQVRFASASAVGGGPLDLVLIVDTSPSMAARVGEPTLLARAKAHAERLAAGLPQSSRVALISDVDRPVRWMPIQTPDLAADLEALEPDPRIASLRPMVARAAEVLRRRSEQDGTRSPLVLVLTDLTAPPLPPGMLSALPPDVPVQVVDVAGQALDNLALEELEVSQTAVLPGQTVRVSGRVRSFAGVASRATLGLSLDGRPQRVVALTLEPGESKPFAFDVVAPAPGVLQGKIAIEEQDVKRDDDALYFSIWVAPRLKVLVVTDPAYESSFGWAALQLALDPEERGRRLQIERALPSELPRRDLRAYPVVILPGIATVPEASWQALERYLRGGGALLTLPGPGMDLGAWRTEVAKVVLGGELVGPEPLPPGTTLVEVDFDHALLAPFRAGRNGDLTSVLWQRLVRVAPAPGTKVLARVGDGRLPGMTEAAVGDGRSLLWTGGLDRRWTDLVRHPSVVPLLHITLDQMVELASPDLNGVVGDALELSVPVRGERMRARVAGPSGGARVLAIDRDAPVLELALDEGPGHYRYVILDESGVVAEGGASASASTDESDLTRIDTGEGGAALGERLGREDVVLRELGTGDDLGQLGAAPVHELTPLIAVLLLALMTFESYWSTLRHG